MKFIHATFLFAMSLVMGCEGKAGSTTATTSASAVANGEGTGAGAGAATPSPSPSPTQAALDIGAVLKDTMVSRATAAGWTASGASAMTLGSQKQTTLSFKKAANAAEIYLATPSGTADEGSMKPQSLADQAASFTKKGLPTKVNGNALVAVTVKKGGTIDPAESKKLFDIVVK